MVRGTGIREKFRSKVLEDLARERKLKKPRLEKPALDDADSEDEDEAPDDQERKLAEARAGSSSLLSILPKPKNSSLFGPTVKLDKLLKLPERADDAAMMNKDREDDAVERLTDDGMLEVDVSKVVAEANLNMVKDLTIEKSKPAVIIPKGKERQKNQITYLAQLGKANELERKEQAVLGKQNKAAARSKYGW